MSRLTDYDHRIKQYAAAEETAGALGDISALRMQSIRRRYQKNQRFFDEIRSLYGVVRAGAERVEAAGTPRVPRLLYIAVTSNRRFAGTLARNTIDTLVRELTKDQTASALVVGRLGWQYLNTVGLGRRARQILFVGEEPTPEEFAGLLAHAARFDRVFVLYGRFVNAFRQEVTMEEISQSPEPVAAGVELYLFEPEVEALQDFFDAQVRYILLERIMLESALARTAARFVTMEEARVRARGLLAREEHKRMQEAAAVGNEELLETFAGYGHWHTDEQHEQ